MSPYAEYPKNPRAQEWGRETIEMQENGSTKNLLQMTDVYYSVSIQRLTFNPLCLIQERDIPLFLEVQIPFLQDKRAKQMSSIARHFRSPMGSSCYLWWISQRDIIRKNAEERSRNILVKMPKNPNPRVEKDS